MIKNIIFDFGDVFINLNKQASLKELTQLGITSYDKQLKEVFDNYEIGIMSSQEFIDYFKGRFQASEKAIKLAWNSILSDFPTHRLNFIKQVAKKKLYRLFLLSNTNYLHICEVQKRWGSKLYWEFKNCFEQFYLSYEINLRKPNTEAFNFVLNQNNLNPKETFFIDDTPENTEAAKKLGIRIWNINPKSEDIVNLFSQKEFL
ncbi:MAG: HAD-IA family hydrolase [Tenacibaculum sp.]